MTDNYQVNDRSMLLSELAQEVATLDVPRPLVAIDGVDGSGKSTFARELSEHFEGKPVILIHVDDFLNLTAVRHRKGRNSPEGFWLDTYDYEALNRLVLMPLSRGGNGTHWPVATEHKMNLRVEVPARQAPDRCIVLIEGMFLHREELRQKWDYSIFLDVPFEETARRMSLRDGSNPDPEHPSMHRYVGGQRLYFEASTPWLHATRVIDNSDPESPGLISPDDASAASS
ncbi:AAA family ATPase [Glutamicibacter sp.]|uniref:AAA family ATPase n=1 Tax=Glutamicibacter sp. TaxID=1931995 RepID=UPI0028BEE010|nr:AAA family ATPase [Glutamicibacter sp.]